MLGTRLRAGITIEIRMRPRPMYTFRVILLMPRYAYAAYPTVASSVDFHDVIRHHVLTSLLRQQDVDLTNPSKN
jgi:hypothetical protein